MKLAKKEVLDRFSFFGKELKIESASNSFR